MGVYCITIYACYRVAKLYHALCHDNVIKVIIYLTSHIGFCVLFDLPGQDVQSIRQGLMHAGLDQVT